MGKKALKDWNSRYKSQKLQAIIVKQLILQHTLELKKWFAEAGEYRKYEECNNFK